MPKQITVLAVALAAALALPAGSAVAAPSYVPGEVLVGIEGGGERLIELPEGVEATDAARALMRNPVVAYAQPNYIARASAVPNDPGNRGKAGGWRFMQWNFLSCGSSCGRSVVPLEFQAPGGIDAIAAWRQIRKSGRAPGRGVRVAVLDTGIAFRNWRKKFRKSPDFTKGQFLPGRDFVKKSKLPLDRDGHGTHIAGTIAERTNNGVALTGLAPAAKLIPVRVLDENGFGNARNISKGIRFAARHRAEVINMSFEFGSSINSCAKIPSVCRALRFATKRHGAVAVAAAGNSNGEPVTFPGMAPRVIAVGRTTYDACVADLSRSGAGLDLVAPGGGGPMSGACEGSRTRPIFQLTFSGFGFRKFGYPSFYTGTSMAAAHVSGVAALVLSSRVLGRAPTRAAVECQLEATARKSDQELGQPYDPTFFGAGLVDAASAVKARAPGC